MSVDSRNTPTSPFEADGVTESTPHPELLSSLGRLVRGLSTLFWGLPMALVVCVQSAKGDWLRPFGIFPALTSTALIYYALDLMTHFQAQERVWRTALDRARLLAVVNIGLSPFLYFWNRIPTNNYFNHVVLVMGLTGLAFLLLLNPTLLRLAQMLPDETLRVETRLFTTLNRYLLAAMIVFLGAYFVLIEYFPAALQRVLDLLFDLSPFVQSSGTVYALLDRGGMWLILFFILLPVAMTMALIWKIKEVILASVFGNTH
jgi:hypothetical protein